MRAFLLGLVLALAVVSPGRADIKQDVRDCAFGQPPQAAIAACTRLLAYPKVRANKKVLAGAHSLRGIAYARLKQYRQAIADYRQAIRLNPRDAEPYYNRGIAYFRLKQYRQALSDYRQAIRLNPRNAIAYYNRGIAYFRLKQYRQAIANYDQAIRLNPRYANAYVNRGQAYSRLKQYRRAIQDYDQAIRLNPRGVEAYNNRGLIYQYVLKNRGQAIADYRAAHKLQPWNSRIAAKLRSLGVEP